MQRFIKHFERKAEGVWHCVEPATLSLPGGRVQVAPGSRFTRGTTFMGVDLARMLDDEYAKEDSDAAS